MSQPAPPPGAGSALLLEPDVHAAADPEARLRVPACPVCHGEEARPCFEVEGLRPVDGQVPRVVVCPRCGLGRFHPMPGPQDVRSFYPDEYYGEPGIKFQPFVERLVRWVGERHLGFLSRGLEPGARILDVGCGRGVILGALADRGFEVHGQEISAAAARGVDPRAKLRIAGSLPEAGYAASFFDEVVIWHVFEHLPDPRGTLEEVHRVLRPGGRLILAVPNFGSLQARFSGPAWFHLDLPRHLYHFPLAALADLLSQTGFEVESEHHFSLRQNPFGWIQSALNRRPALPRNALYTLLHERPRDQPPPFDRWTRAWLRLCFAVGAPIGLGLTLLETALRSGATVHLVAHKV